MDVEIGGAQPSYILKDPTIRAREGESDAIRNADL